MPKYAYFDHTQPAPSRVLGWYDTDFVGYLNLPDPGDLFLMSEEQWSSRMQGIKAIDDGLLVGWTPPPPPPPTLAQQAQAMMTAGIQIVSLGTPEIAGTYAVGPADYQQIAGTVASIAAGLGLPGGGETFLWPDTSGQPHPFSAKNFTDFARAVMNWNYLLSQIAGGAPLSLPDATVTID